MDSCVSKFIQKIVHCIFLLVSFGGGFFLNQHQLHCWFLSSRFILPGEVDIEIPYEDFLSPDEEMDARREKEAKKRQELLLSVNFSK